MNTIFKKSYIYIIFIVILLFLGGCSNRKNISIIPTVSPNLPSVSPSPDSILSIPDNMLYTIAYFDYNRIYKQIDFYNNQNELIKTFYNAHLPYLPEGLIPSDAYTFVGISTYDVPANNYADNYIYGLYDFNLNDWYISPIYTNILQSSDYYFACYDNKFDVFDSKYTLLFSGLCRSNNSLISQVGKNIIYNDYNTEEIILYSSKDGKILKEHQSTNFYLFGSDYYVVYSSDDNASDTIYDSEGNLVLDHNTISKICPPEYKDYPLRILNCNNNFTLILVQMGTYYIVLDSDFNIISSCNINDNYNFGYLIYDNFFCLEDYSSGTFKNTYYNIHGKPLTHVFEDSAYIEYMSANKLYTVEDSKIIIYNIDTKDTLTINTDYDSSYEIYVMPMLEDFYIVTASITDKNYYVNSIYYKDNLIMASTFLNYNAFNNCIVINNSAEHYDSLNYLFKINYIYNDQGELIYTSPVKEEIINVTDYFILVRRGNYIGIVDFNGDFIQKTLNPELSND